MAKFTILITTKNRISDLKITLKQISFLIKSGQVLCSICDDASQDETSDFIKTNYPEIELFSNKNSQGCITNRNFLLNNTKTPFAISLDDDAVFATQNPLQGIEDFFDANPKCGLLGFRIFWGLALPNNISTTKAPKIMKSFVGCGHVWRMSCWRDIPNYPEWFEFYGEEDFASYHMFLKKWTVMYFPKILVHHRVDVKNRKKQNDHYARAHKNLRSAFFLYSLFYPKRCLPKTLSYIPYSVFRNKILKGDFKIIKPLLLAIKDFLLAIPIILKNRKPLTIADLNNFKALPDAEIYWDGK